MKLTQAFILFLCFSFYSFGEVKKEEAKATSETVPQSVKKEKSTEKNKKEALSHPKTSNKNKDHKEKPIQTSKTKSSKEKKEVSEKKEKASQTKENVSKKKKKASQKKTSLRIKKIKKGSIFEELKFKENDIISKINGVFIKNTKHFIKQLKKIRKKSSSFNVTLIRNNKTIILNYVVKKDPDSSNYKYTLKKPSAKKKESDSKDILKKYSHLFQKAYVQQAGGSLVYEKPSFDSKQIYMIPFGEQIIISKKILKPEKEIGTFYKIFIKKPQKIAGYISQVEVLPQTVKKGNRYIPNPKYALWKKKVKSSPLDEEGIFSPSFSESVGDREEEISQKAETGRFIGIALGSSLGSEEKFTDRLRFGLKLSGYNLLVSYINMDINFLFDTNWSHMLVDIMGSYFFLQSGSFKAGPALGLNTNLQFKDQEIRLDMIVALSGLLPLTHNLIWRNDIRFTGFFDKPIKFYFLTALQWGF